MKTISPCAMLVLLLAATGPAVTPAQSQGIRGAVAIGNAQRARLYARYDAGPVSATMPMHRMEMVLRPGAARRAGLEQFVADQQNPSSAEFHRWLSPEQFADRFGVPQADAAQVAAWLQSVGMTNVRIARGRMFVTYSGAAGAVEGAFRVAIHGFSVGGHRHYANVSAPSIPVALSGMVSDVIGFDDFNPAPQWIPATSITTQYASGSGNDLGPDDLAAIYNVKPLYAGGIAGSGTTVAVLGQTPISLADYRAYRQMFGLTANDFQVVPVPDSGSGTNAVVDQIEATLDTEVLGAVARNATLLYVWGSTAIDAAQYVVDNRLAQVMSLSYAGCEDGSALYYQDIALQANAEGITWVNAAGDSGAAGCDTISSASAVNGLAVTSPGSVPQITAVGGTAFVNGSSSQYWSSTNNSQEGSALGYVPETGWSDQDAVMGGGGGASLMFAKAGYQSDFDTTVTSGRLVPDVALASSPSAVPYLIVFNGSNLLVGGTSAAAPVFAGIAALVNQSQLAMGEIAQPGLGNMNPTLYLLAEKIPDIFHDVTSGSNRVPCTLGTTDCATGTLGFSAVTGYDQATGLGSVDAFALASNWANVTLGQAFATLASSTTQNQAAQLVTFSASITGEGGAVNRAPVTFYYSNLQSQPSAVSFGTAFTDATGTATIASSIFPAGSNTVTAVFGGSTTVASGAESNSVTVAISAFPTVTALALAGGPYRAGEAATFTVSVSAPGDTALGGPDATNAHYLPGTVALYAADGTLQAQSAVLAGGSATLTTNSLVAGDNTFYASYSGNYYAAVSQSSPFTLTATQLAGTGTVTTLTASDTDVSLGASVVLTAKVSAPSNSSAPTGSVTFFNGTTAIASSSLNTAGSAAITMVPGLGTATMVAVYGGSSSLNSSTSAPLTVTVGNTGADDFTISGPGSTTMTAGSSAGITLSITPLNGFSGSILLSCAGLPTADICTIPGSVTPQGATPVQVTIATTPAPLMAAMPLSWLGFLLIGGARRRKRILLLAVLAACVTLIAGCGDAVKSASASATSSAATSSQSYTATVTATSGSICHQFQIAVTVDE